MENKKIITRNYNNLIGKIADILTSARTKVIREINKAQVLAYWEIGREIVEFEQKGKERAEYGEERIARLSKDLTNKFGKGFSERNLEQMRKLYLTYSQKAQTLSAKFEPMLSWAHYCELLKVEEPLARSFYEQEAIQKLRE